MTSSIHKRSLWRVHNLTWKSLALFRALWYCELYTYSCTYCWLKFILTSLSILSPKLLAIWIIVFFCGSGLSFCEFVSLYYWVNVWLEATRPGFCLKEHRWPINFALVQPADDHIRAMFLSRNRVVEGHSGPGQSVNINSSCAAAAGYSIRHLAALSRPGPTRLSESWKGWGAALPCRTHPRLRALADLTAAVATSPRHGTSTTLL